MINGVKVNVEKTLIKPINTRKDQISSEMLFFAFFSPLQI